MITELQIEGFGPFHDVRLPLGEQLTLVVGPNGSGKSTLVRFVRYVLFGKSPRRSVPADEALAGGRLGGSLTLHGAAGPLRVERIRNELSLVRDGLPVEDSELAAQIGFVDRTAFDAVFACAPSDLSQLEALHDQALQKRLFASSVSGRRADATAVLKSWREQLRKLGLGSRSGGALQALKERRAEVVAQLGQARAEAEALPQLVAQREGLRAELAELERKRGTLQAQRMRLAQAQVVQQSLRAVAQRVAEPTRRRGVLRSSIDEVRQRWASTDSDDAPQVRRWLASAEGMQRRAASLAGAREAVAEVDARLDAILERQPGRWDRELLTSGRDVPWARLGALAQDVLRIRTDESSEQVAVPESRATPSVTWPLAVVAVLAVVASLVAFGLAEWVAGAVLAGLAAILLAALLWVSVRASGQRVQAAAIAQQLWAERARQAEQRLAHAVTEQPVPLPEDPTTLELLCRRIPVAFEQLDRAVAAEREVEVLDGPLREWVAEAAVVSRVAGRPAPRGSAAAVALTEPARAWLDDLEQLASWGTELVEVERQLERLASEREEHTANLGSLTQDTSIEQLLAQVDEEGRALDQAGESLQQQLGSLADRIRGIERSSRVIEASSELAAVDDEREHVLRRMAELQLASELLEETYGRFVAEEQPPVLSRASDLVQQATEGRWIGVQAEGRKLLAQAEDGSLRGPQQLSRGTRDLMYLAVRLALALRHAESVPLPILLDDVLVNQDPERARSLARVVSTVAQQQQVILTTCHPRIHQLFVELVPDATVLALPLTPSA